MQKYPRIIAQALTILSMSTVGCSSIQQAPSIDPAEIIAPPIELLGHGARAPTAEELAQEKVADARQVQRAIERLKSVDVRQRIIGTESLNAYQTTESEQQLSHTLIHDDAAEVRQTAAQSLGFFKVLSEQTVSALLKALDDDVEKNRRESLYTLLNYTLRLGSDSNQYQCILHALDEKVSTQCLHKEVHSSLTAFIKDQQKPEKNVFFSPTDPPSQGLKSPSQASTPAPATRPLAKQAVNK